MKGLEGRERLLRPSERHEPSVERHRRLLSMAAHCGSQHSVHLTSRIHAGAAKCRARAAHPEAAHPEFTVGELRDRACCRVRAEVREALIACEVLTVVAARAVARLHALEAHHARDFLSIQCTAAMMASEDGLQLLNGTTS